MYQARMVCGFSVKDTPNFLGSITARPLVVAKERKKK